MNQKSPARDHAFIRADLQTIGGRIEMNLGVVLLEKGNCPA